MATARLTFDECWGLIRKLIDLVNIQFHTLADGTALRQPTMNYTTLEDGFQGSMDGSRARLLLDDLSVMRQNSVDFLLRARNILVNLVLEMARSPQVLSPAGNDFERAFRDCWLYMHNNSKWVRRRVASFGTPAVSAATGSGKWYRCTKDVKNYDVESPQADVTAAECVSDATTGASSGKEVFELASRTAGRDILEQLGLGLVRQLTVASSLNSILDDGGFEGTLETSGTTLTGEWETDDASDFLVETGAGNYFRGAQGVKMVNAGAYVRQLVTNINRATPYFACMRLKDVATRSGTARLTLGSKTKNYTLGATSGWVDIVIGCTAGALAIDSDAWPDNWLTTTPYFRFEILSAGLGGTGDLYFDEAVLAPMTEFGGYFNTLTAGATDWLTGTPGDKWTVTDSFSDKGVIQFWTKLLLGRYWPHKPTGSYNITDPTLLTSCA